MGLVELAWCSGVRKPCPPATNRKKALVVHCPRSLESVRYLCCGPLLSGGAKSTATSRKSAKSFQILHPNSKPHPTPPLSSRLRSPLLVLRFYHSFMNRKTGLDDHLAPNDFPCAFDPFGNALDTHSVYLLLSPSSSFSTSLSSSLTIAPSSSSRSLFPSSSRTLPTSVKIDRISWKVSSVSSRVVGRKG